MFYLFLSVLSNVGILLAFRLAGRNKIHALSMVSVNYIIASVLGVIVFFHGEFQKELQTNNSPFFLGAAVLIGMVFLLMFLLVQLSTNKAGMAVTSAAAKLSVVFPILVSLLIDPYDLLNMKKGLGFLSMFLATALIIFTPNKKKSQRWDLLIPVVLFLGMGCVDSIVKITQQFLISEDVAPLFTLLVFCFAGISGVFILIVKGETKKILNKKTLLLGILLGICNYGSLYYIVKTLNLNSGRNEFLDSSRIFMFNNICIILISVLIGVFLFKEKLKLINYVGLLLSILGFAMLV